MTNTTDKMLPGDIEALLPWYAAGTLDRTEAVAVERALATDRELARRCALVQEELHETILLNEALGSPSTRVMENLFRTIDKERKTARAQAPSSETSFRMATTASASQRSASPRPSDAAASDMSATWSMLTSTGSRVSRIQPGVRSASVQ